jgi:transcriptional regulator with XRE-family HTH domain
MAVTDLVRLADVRAIAESGTARSLRLAAGLSLAEVAEHVGVSPVTVYRWEVGDRRPRGEAALRYGRLLEALADRQQPRRRRKATP